MNKKLIGMVLAAALALSLAACGNKYQKLSGSEAQNALENASTLYLTGDLDDVNTFSDIVADEQIVGKVQEKGLLVNTMTVSVDDKEQFYCRYANNDEFWNDAGTTYVCCAMDNTVLGYMHCLYGDGVSYYAFCGPDRSEKGYYLDDDLTTFTDSAGRTVGTVEAVLDSVLSHAFHVTIKTDAGAGIDYIDKLMVYWSAVHRLNSEYSYLT